MNADITSWGLSVLCILFLSACAWHNRRTGYNRSSRNSAASGPLAAELAAEPRDDSNIHHTDQLIRLSAVIHPGEKVCAELTQETGAVKTSR